MTSYRNLVLINTSYYWLSVVFLEARPTRWRTGSMQAGPRCTVRVNLGMKVSGKCDSGADVALRKGRPHSRSITLAPHWGQGQ
jgi:hypothetical protein